MNYATLTQVRAYLGLAATETSDDTRLTTFIREASAFVDQYCIRRFDVRQETRKYDYPIRKASVFGVYSADEWVSLANAAGDLSRGTLRMDDDLLSVTTLTNGDATVIASASYVLEPPNEYPKHLIRLLASSGVAWQLNASGDREQVISVAGLWGYHENYSAAWCDSLDTVRDNPLTAAATTLTVADADGTAEDLDAPRFQAGQMIRVESEYLSVISVNATANTLVVKRAVNGSTAAAHAQGVAITLYRPMETVKDAVVRLAVWKYRQKDANVFDKTTILQTGIAITPSAVPPDVLEKLPAPKSGIGGRL